jgi:hypothetical protein
MDDRRSALRTRTYVVALLVETWRRDATPLGTLTARSRREAQLRARARWPPGAGTAGWLRVRAAGSVPADLLARAGDRRAGTPPPVTPIRLAARRPGGLRRRRQPRPSAPRRPALRGPYAAAAGATAP